MIAKEQIFMALFLFLLGGWAVYAGLHAPHPDPRFRVRNDRRFTFSVLLAQVSPRLERMFSKSVVVLGGLGLLAAGVFVLLHRW